jgi:GTP cyclohydrolase IA
MSNMKEKDISGNQIKSNNNNVNDNYLNLSEEDKINKISDSFKEIMLTLGLDLNDDSLKETPNRVAKMYVQELFSGLDESKMPDSSLFINNYSYNSMLIEKDIELYSICEHHFVPIIGKAHVAYIAKDNIIGLSKINRIVRYFSRRPQVQERLTKQIVDALKRILNIEDIACVIDAKHLCVNMRGVKDTQSSTITAVYSGKFQKDNIKQEFLQYINKN